MTGNATISTSTPLGVLMAEASEDGDFYREIYITLDGHAVACVGYCAAFDGDPLNRPERINVSVWDDGGFDDICWSTDITAGEIKGWEEL